MMHWSNQAEMVANLFKQMPGNGGTFMHAAVGMAGEAGEILTAPSRKNLLLELGDFEFYLEAAWQALACPASERGLKLGDYHAGLDSNLVSLGIETAKLLDTAKKAWVYEQPLNGSSAAMTLIGIGQLLDGIYELIGAELHTVRLMNIEKLSARYPQGHYSDKAATMKVDQCAVCGADREDGACPNGH